LPQPAPTLVEPTSGTAEPVLPAFAIDVESSQRDAAAAIWPQPGKRRLIIGVACAALTLVAIVAVIAVSHKGSANSATAKAPALSSPAVPVPSAAPQPSPTPVNTLAGEPAKPNTKAQNSRVQEKSTHPIPGSTVPSTSPANQQKVVGGKCVLDPALISKALDQAERSRDQGKYDAAERQFRSVLACEPDNATARNGLERVLLAKQTAN